LKLENVKLIPVSTKLQVVGLRMEETASRHGGQ